MKRSYVEIVEDAVSELKLSGAVTDSEITEKRSSVQDARSYDSGYNDGFIKGCMHALSLLTSGDNN